jgi:hypothetical protein
MALLGQLKAITEKVKGTKIVPMVPKGPLDLVQLDATFSRDLELGGQLSTNPVQGRQSVADNLARQPPRMSIEGEFTDTPVQFLAGLSNIPNRALSQLRKLEELRDREEPCYVFTALGARSDMVIVNVTARQDVESGDTIQISIMLERATIVSAAFIPSEIDLDAKLAGAGGTLDMGTQAPIDPNAYTPPPVAF